jgi:hypothetical protein
MEAMAPGCFYKTVGLPEFEKKHESMRDGLSSEFARRMTVEELKGYLEDE